MVKISVIIPVYNTEKYLGECLESVINQTFRDIEIICIDDGSTDNSLNILKEYEDKDSRIKLFAQDHGGASAARNHGLDHASGEYIYFIDSDDYLNLDALEKFYIISQEKDLDLLIFKLVNFDEKTGERDYEYSRMAFLSDIENDPMTYLDFKDYLFKVDVSPCTKFFKRELIEGIRFKEGLIFEDNLFYINYIFEAKRIYVLDEYLYFRRIREDSVITNTTISHIDLIKIYNLIKEKFENMGIYDEFKEDLFMDKIGNLYERFIEIKPEYKQEYYEKMKKEFSSQKEEYESEFDLDKITQYYKVIFPAVINSNNSSEIESYIKIYRTENKIKKLKDKNKKLKREIKYLKNQNNELLSSKSWKITEPLRKLMRNKK